MIEILSKDWCGPCKQLTRQLDELGVEYINVDAEKADPAHPIVVQAYNANRRFVPQLYIDGIYIENTNAVLQELKNKSKE